MKDKSINIIYIIGLVASFIFPFALYLHHNNPGIKYIKPDFINDIRYSVDICSYDGEKVVIKGWAFPSHGQIGKLTRLYFENDGKIYPVYKKTIKSPDVMRLFGQGKRYGMIGFHGAKKMHLNDRSIHLLISIEDTDGKIHETKYTCQ